MFTELKALLERRSLTITVAAVHEDQIRVNVIPHCRPEDTKVNGQISYSHKDHVARIPEAAVKALTTPISLTGTAEEIDSRLSAVLLEFVESHTQLQGSFDRASMEIAEAAKAIDERNKARLKSKAASSKSEAKTYPKTKPDDDNSKAADTLPLWWTNSSVLPPGGPAPNSSPVVAPGDGSQATNESEKTQEVASKVSKSSNT